MITKIVALAVAGFVGGWLGFSVSDRDVPVLIHSMSAAPAAASPGETVRMQYEATRVRSCATHVERLLFAADGQRFVLPDLEFASGTLPIGLDRFAVPTAVPLGTPFGRATYRTINCYACNPSHRIWPICDNPRDIPFTVKPPD